MNLLFLQPLYHNKTSIFKLLRGIGKWIITVDARFGGLFFGMSGKFLRNKNKAVEVIQSSQQKTNQSHDATSRRIQKSRKQSI